MRIVNVTHDQITSFFVNDPKLIIQALSDEEIVILHQRKEDFVNEYSHYRGIEDDGIIKALVKWEYFTTKTLNVHTYVSTEYQKTGFTKHVVQLVRDFFRESEFLKLIFMVPSTCPHVVKTLTKAGLKQEGYITNSYEWRQEVVDLYIFGFTLSEKLSWEQ